MRPLPSVLVMLALVLTAVGAALFIAGPPPSSVPPAGESRVAEPAAHAGAPPVAAPAAAVPGRRGRVLPLAEAIKELDLIKPARQKLADDFKVPTPAGDTFRLGDQRGKVVMVNFWATWCPPCLEEMPAMERLYRKHKDAGFTLVAISVDADPRKVTPFVSEHKLTMPIGVDAKMDLAQTYGVRALPSSFVIGRDGNLAALAIGPRHWDSDAAHSLVEGMLR
ncbi:MAG TPA: TlpA disulfide reductase family protein [Candidatus Binatia bacterium]|nr:TlpA disulfide reductase family protein [Candidatus Binatia bacterium]